MTVETVKKHDCDERGGLFDCSCFVLIDRSEVKPRWAKNLSVCTVLLVRQKRLDNGTFCRMVDISPMVTFEAPAPERRRRAPAVLGQWSRVVSFSESSYEQTRVVRDA
jgi:hypothetical protein